MTTKVNGGATGSVPPLTPSKKKKSSINEDYGFRPFNELEKESPLHSPIKSREQYLKAHGHSSSHAHTTSHSPARPFASPSKLRHSSPSPRKGTTDLLTKMAELHAPNLLTDTSMGIGPPSCGITASPSKQMPPSSGAARHASPTRVRIDPIPRSSGSEREAAKLPAANQTKLDLFASPTRPKSGSSSNGSGGAAKHPFQSPMPPSHSPPTHSVSAAARRLFDPPAHHTSPSHPPPHLTQSHLHFPATPASAALSTPSTTSVEEVARASSITIELHPKSPSLANVSSPPKSNKRKHPTTNEEEKEDDVALTPILIDSTPPASPSVRSRRASIKIEDENKDGMSDETRGAGAVADVPASPSAHSPSTRTSKRIKREATHDQPDNHLHPTNHTTSPTMIKNSPNTRSSRRQLEQATTK